MKNTPLNALCAAICLFLLNACAGPAGKPVSEPLTLEEVEHIAQKHPGFERIYQNSIFPQVDRLPEHSLFRQRLKSLSYEEYLEFYNLVLNNNFNETLSLEYAEKYDKVELTRRVDVIADSLVKDWEDYYAQNAPSTYAKIELDGITKEFVPDHWTGEKEIKVSAQLKVTPLKGRIDKLSATWGLTKNADGSYPLGDGKIEIDTPFEQTITVNCALRIFRVWYSDRTCENYFRNTPANTIKRKTYFYTSSIEVTSNGNVINNQMFYDMRPYNAVFYQEERNNPDDRDFKRHREELAKAYIDRNYREDLQEYVSNRTQQELYKSNPLAFALFFGEDVEAYCLQEWGETFK